MLSGICFKCKRCHSVCVLLQVIFTCFRIYPQDTQNSFLLPVVEYFTLGYLQISCVHSILINTYCIFLFILFAHMWVCACVYRTLISILNLLDILITHHLRQHLVSIFKLFIILTNEGCHNCFNLYGDEDHGYPRCGKGMRVPWFGGGGTGGLKALRQAEEGQQIRWGRDKDS